VADQQGPQEPVPSFPTAEGGAVPADQFFEGTVWNYLIVLDMTQTPVVLRDPLRFYLIRAANDFIGEGNWNVWLNDQSIAIRCRAISGKMDAFSQRVREAAEIFATHHIVRINEYTMSQRK
jgi:hypothetical protein